MKHTSLDFWAMLIPVAYIVLIVLLFDSLFLLIGLSWLFGWFQ